ncbi:hypothetical protein BKA00_003915 [Actinomadura coerulea]|uniref:Uncharacterized protein n=1 Tax=Actinomadura coerulea TaxID=46159 RepID=A0A7X0G237_9ACTN|nr:hypothetical protein [Actinomadura coerulea]MBB6397001.1 hypothetical protein [Actinomadura coerulea]GGP95936.1 hypothetical protein GCM10010187_09430 [Actinomadura coerulea]
MSPGDLPDADLQRTADILFTAKVKAAELRFEVVPDVSVTFTEGSSDDSTSGSARTNLPDQVKTQTTYQDIQIDYAIAAKLAPPPE